MAAAKRSNSEDDIREKSADYHGTARCERVDGVETVESIRFYLTFEEALRLSLAIQSCAMRLNKYDRRTRKGQNMGMKLTFWHKDKISVMEWLIEGKRQREQPSEAE